MPGNSAERKDGVATLAYGMQSKIRGFGGYTSRL
jgi:hypothetical protein